MNLTTDQRDTLAYIYSAAGDTHGPVEYVSKQLAPNCSDGNRPRFFAALEDGGYCIRIMNGTGTRTIGIELTPKGVAAAVARRAQALPMLMSSLHHEEIAHQKRFLPDLLTG
jgi:hypothetical protein